MTENVQARQPVRLKPEDVLFFNRQLASMARLNMPLAKGLKILSREVQDPNFRRLIDEVQHDLDEGKTLQEALGKHPETFNSLHLEIIKAGETTGNLAVILDELNAHTEAMQRVKNRVVEAITYPAVISAAIFGFVLMFLIYVAPEFETMLRKGQALMAPEADGAATAVVETSRLRWETELLFGVSHVVGVKVAGVPIVALLLVAAGIAGGVYGLRRVSRMGEQYDDVLFRVPLFGKLFERAALMKVTRTMRDLLLNGVSMVETLRLTARTVGDNRISRKLDDLRGAVEEGGSFSRNLAAGDVFPETMVWKLQMAEEKGIIEEALGELAGEFEIAVDQQTTLITKFLSPVLLIVMGGVVFVMFLACFVPLTQMYQGGGL